MLSGRSIAAFGLVAILGTVGGAQAFDGPKYPDWTGHWVGFFSPELTPNGPGQAFAGWDQTKPWGLGQQAPLTPEYQAALEASLADQAKGGLGNFPTTLGRPAGMPNMMMGFGPQEYVITAATTYILIGLHDHYRRIFTDGRDWPARIEPTFSGYSIGRWIDSDGDGREWVAATEVFDGRGANVLSG